MSRLAALSVNQIHALDAMTHNIAVKCIKEQFTYDQYREYVASLVAGSCLIIYPRKWYEAMATSAQLEQMMEDSVHAHLSEPKK